MKRAEMSGVSDPAGGALDDDGRAEVSLEFDNLSGPSVILSGLCATYEDIQKARLAAQQRGHAALGDEMKRLEDRTGRQIKRELMAQPVWPWLSQFPGLGGVHVARLVAIIGDPRRFPGQQCSAAHTMPPDLAVGDSCPVEECTGTMLAPRTTTGVRSIWHYCGLHVVDGAAPHKRKGQRVDWNPTARTACLMPGGIAEQIVRLRVPIYRERYDAEKARLTGTRAVIAIEIGVVLGPQDGAEADRTSVIDDTPGLRPIQIEKIARTIAAKAFLGDLLMAMKRVAEWPR